ncbi:hypothetical protein [Streptomyces sp. AC512_CC834]|uniref:hypothetical protein n=1 Tax=Streptomyces sp. AC512_CC834 TaxID=2823691 RepID=UPI0020B826F8|nr:hypothetical protein [Streptomyces sp. AC512_CC834]
MDTTVKIGAETRDRLAALTEARNMSMRALTEEFAATALTPARLRADRAHGRVHGVVIVEHYVLDSPTLLALDGSKQIAGLLHIAAGDPTVRVWVPVVCVLEAERQRSGIVGCLGILDVLHTPDADCATARTATGLYRRKLPFGVGAAVHATRPTLDRPDGALVATVAPALYEASASRSWTSAGRRPSAHMCWRRDRTLLRGVLLGRRRPAGRRCCGGRRWPHTSPCQLQHGLR